MLRQILVVAALLVGIGVVGLGATWKYWHSPKMLWSAEQANEYNEAWRALKAAATSGVRRADPNTDPKFAAAQARFDAISAKLDHAKTLNGYGGTILVVIGAVITAVSAWLYFSLPPTTPSTEDV